MSKENNNSHAGHRERMLEKYLKSGFNAFPDHELFEILLYGVMRRVNTNELGHALIEKFGSIRGVLNASHDELIGVPGIGDKAAMNISLVAELMRRYYTSTCDREKFGTVDKVGSFFVHKYIGESNEAVYAMLLTNSLGFIDCRRICEGNINSSKLEIDKICKYAYSRQASKVIIAHNHPGGVLIPSDDDRKATTYLLQALDLLGIKLIEHFIIVENTYLPIMRNSGNGALKRISEEALPFEDIEYVTGKVK
ncbi:MAG: JAB domain-containing protein [Clostridia bacterium]|nr:JAB domain-containing protein [Clostridia bacterium]